MKNTVLKLSIFIYIVWGLPWKLNSQNFDYHREESMAISWNGVELTDARSLATGGLSFLSSRAFAAASNPATIFGEGQILAGMGVELMNFAAYQYWGVNQGVLKAPDGLGDVDLKISGFSITLPIRSFNLSFGWYLSALLEFPDFDHHQNYWQYTGSFSGRSDHFFLTAACQPVKKLQLGIKLVYSAGKRSVDMSEYYYFEEGYYVLFEQQEVHKSRSLIGTMGLVYRVSPCFRLGMDFDYQLSGSVNRTITRSFENNFSLPTIMEEQSTRDDFIDPPRFRVSASLDVLKKNQTETKRHLILGMDATSVWWSGYKYIFLGETQNRDMRNTVVFALGLEYGTLQDSFDYFFRLGYRLDPQPVKDPLIALHAFTGGFGVGFNRFSIDIGMAYYTGSTDDISQNHLVICGTLIYRIKGE